MKIQNYYNMELKIYNNGKPNSYAVTSNNHFFNTQVVYNVKRDCIVFKKVSLDDNKRIVTPTKKGNMYRVTMSSADNIIGKYKIYEEDVNEDTLTVYFDEKLGI